MSEFYAEKNTETTVKLFNKRQLYRAQLLSRGDSNIVDFYRGEKILYGRVTSRFLPVVVGELLLQPLTSAADAPRAPHALDFVAYVFNAMTLQFQKCAASGQIDVSDPYLSQLKAYKAYTSPSTLYLQYRKLYSTLVGDTLKANGVQFTNFEQFIDYLFINMRNVIASKPITYPGFMKSAECSIMSSGLAIEIADMDYINDEEKMSGLVNSKNWDFFVRTCNSYGFMVDCHVPWRIVADVRSDLMKEQASKFGYKSVMDEAYATAFSQYFKGFVPHLLEMYNAARLEAYEKVEVCTDGSTKTRIMYSESYTADELVRKYDAYYFIKIYLQLRLFEERPEMSAVHMKKVIKEFVNITKHTNSLSAISFGFEQIMNKPFDKSGSMGYYIKKVVAQAQADFADGTIDNITIDDMGMPANDFSSY
jgi:hypothetical protein|tara:strand:- start:2547 stop:3809 length:1263 start_codon:yes stop_codon:yes gene_type:complete